MALSELPDFTCRPGTHAQDHHGAGIIIGPTIGYLERAYLDARFEGWSRAPVIEMLIPTTLDPGLAPAGRHVASLFVQHVAPHLPDGRSWADVQEKEAFGDLVIDTVTRYAPNFERSVLSVQLLSPLEQEALLQATAFAGSFTIEAFEAVVGPSHSGALDALHALLRHNLLRSEPAPDPSATATQDEMVGGMKAIKEYNSAVTTYLSCLETEMNTRIEAAGPEAPADQVEQIKAIHTKRHNAAVEALEQQAARFNEQVKVFKARDKKS